MAVPIIEQITQNIVAELKLVTITNGFNNDLEVEQPAQAGNRVRDRLVVVYQTAVDQVEPPQGHVAWNQTYAIVCFVREKEGSDTSIDTRINSIRSDVERKLRQDNSRGGLAVETELRPPLIFEQKGAAGVIVNVDVLYRVLEDDPFAQ